MSPSKARQMATLKFQGSSNYRVHDPAAMRVPCNLLDTWLRVTNCVRYQHMTPTLTLNLSQSDPINQCMGLAICMSHTVCVHHSVDYVVSSTRSDAYIADGEQVTVTTAVAPPTVFIIAVALTTTFTTILKYSINSNNSILFLTTTVMQK